MDDGPRGPAPWHGRTVPVRLAPPPYAVRTRAQLDCPEPWTDAVVAALGAAGVDIDRSAPVGIAVAPARLVSATVDGWSVDSLPHVLVGVQPWAVDIGPWVAPGVGPCARCVAAVVLDDGADPVAGAAPRPLLALAAGAVARDLIGWSRGELPHTWLTSWRVDHHPLPTARRWQRHPYCGCAWFDGGFDGGFDAGFDAG